MEKKGNRALPGSVRPSVTDTKKNQDVTTGKVWPRNGRRRESAGPGLSSKNESSSRKPQPHRAKMLDKRPKPRGSYYGSGTSRTETSGLGLPEDAELGSVFVPGSKKQSLNHLLNFSYTPYMPRDGYAANGARPKGGPRSIATKKHKYNKEHFLQANCQFVVNEKGDYRQYMNNPDALVDWDLIEQVNVQVTDVSSCPICLYPPVAAKMTRCGHVYCWSCILHYLALSDKTWRKCPICYEAVHKKDLKSVVPISHHTFNSNEIITFKLMKRPRGSLIAYPADLKVKKDGVIFNMREENVGDIYSKLILANKTDILAIIERESAELTAQLLEDENAPEKCFIEEAVTLLKEREDLMTNESLGEKVKESSVEDEKIVAYGVEDLKELDEFVDELTLNDDIEVQFNMAPTENFDILQENSAQAKFHYFYQAADGQHIYLHAVNARMLEHTYGSLEFGPKTISGKILEKEGGSMTEDLRKRLRYLQHLPVTCQFEVAEIQLRSPVISRDTLDHFQEQLEIRKKKRQRRAKDEKKREKRIEAEEFIKMGKIPQPEIHLESHMQFPDFEEAKERLRNESECTNQSENSSETDLLTYFTPISNETIGEISYSGPSFAKMLVSEKKQQPTWPGLKASLSTPAPVKLINVTGTKMSTPAIGKKVHSDSDTEIEGYEPVPDRCANFGDAIAEALNKATNQDNVGGLALGGKKKKKGKQVLFTTNIAYKGN